MGLREATLAVCLVLFGAPGPAVARSGQGLACTADWTARLDQPIFVDGGS